MFWLLITFNKLIRHILAEREMKELGHTFETKRWGCMGESDKRRQGCLNSCFHLEAFAASVKKKWAKNKSKNFSDRKSLFDANVPSYKSRFRIPQTLNVAHKKHPKSVWARKSHLFLCFSSTQTWTRGDWNEYRGSSIEIKRILSSSLLMKVRVILRSRFSQFYKKSYYAQGFVREEKRDR